MQNDATPYSLCCIVFDFHIGVKVRKELMSTKRIPLPVNEIK